MMELEMHALSEIFGLEEHLPTSFAVAVTLVRFFLIAAQVELVAVVWRLNKAGALIVGTAGFMLLALSGLFNVDAIVFNVPREAYWWRPVAACWVVGSFGTYVMLWLWRAANRLGLLHRDGSPAQGSKSATTMGRREFLKPVAALAVAAPFGVAGYGILIGRRKISVDERDIYVPGLPDDLDGFKIVQLTDIHCGPFFSLPDLDFAIDMANDCGANLAVVTGDLITTKHDPLEGALDRLATLKSDFGVVGCLGNHEIHADAENFTKLYGARKGIRFFRSESQLLAIGSSKLNVVGVDYQRKAMPYLTSAESHIRSDATNILLSHNPDVFPKAAELGYDLTIGGHTHGGQVTMEIAEQYLNPARFFTPYVYGEYNRGNAALYVSRGLGTVNLPMRIGALPEIPLLRLKQS
jgi:predicted MPP superfamily phosphohydrolase